MNPNVIPSGFFRTEGKGTCCISSESSRELKHVSMLAVNPVHFIFANIEPYSRLDHYSGWQLVDCVQSRPNSSQMMTRGRQNILESFGLGRAGVRAFVGVVWPWVVKSPGRGTGGLVGTGYIDIELLDRAAIGFLPVWGWNCLAFADVTIPN